MKTILLVLMTFVTVGLAVAMSRPAQAFDLFGQACSANSNNNSQNSSVCQSSGSSQNASGDNSLYGKNGVLTKAIVILDILIGIIAVIMVIVGGLKYVLSGGDSNQTNSARDTILYAVIGIVVAVMGRAIIIFVINRL